MRTLLAVSLLSVGPSVCLGQLAAIDVYLENSDACAVAQAAPSLRTKQDIERLLPNNLSQRFAQYVISRATETTFAGLRSDVEGLRLNKLIGATSGASGTTSLVSKVAVPAFLGFATEYGSILQTNNGNTSTLRGNLFGISRMFVGGVRYPSCQPALQGLDRFSGTISFESVSSAKPTGAAQTSLGIVPVVADLFGNNFRMAAWGARFDFTKNNPDSEAYVKAWSSAISNLRAGNEISELGAAASGLFVLADHSVNPAYLSWREDTVAILQSAASLAEFRRKLAERLDLLVIQMSVDESDFKTRVTRLNTAFLNYSTVRDNLLKEIQSNRLSLEYTNRHPRGEANTSNVRFIYSHQPGSSPLVLTANAAVTFYHALPAVVKNGAFRDVQLAAQIDRRLGHITTLGDATATFGAYYQWMREDALIIIGAGNLAPGSGIVLPGTAATLLGTKGHIGVLQGKLSIPVNNAVKVPISVTWSNRAELIKESDIRGQIGLTLDLDAVFKK